MKLVGGRLGWNEACAASTRSGAWFGKLWLVVLGTAMLLAHRGVRFTVLPISTSLRRAMA